MSLKEIKQEILYYADIEATDEEASEIAMFYNQGSADLDEVISDYYGCI
ncbi:MAG: hypothetical protein J6A25_07790 [Lachnospiraceae bacterium]|nr:hypothetical protein [Lachnospiraceae bacterium]MBO5425400.1 hypothetical protein [Lachnospiraceae bacterium]